MPTNILAFPVPIVYTRAAVEARLAEARKARGRDYDAASRNRAITAYLDALRDALEGDHQGWPNG